MSYPINQSLIPGLPKTPYRHGIGAYEGVVAHATDSYAPDENEVNYFENNWRQRQAFVHFFVDWDSIQQTAETDYIGWGAGHTANQRYVHVELCQTKDAAQFAESYKRYVWLIAWLLHNKRLGVEFGRSLVTHHWVSQNLGNTDHVDPDAYLAENGKTIDGLAGDVKAAYDAMDGVVITGTPIVSPATATVDQAQAWAKAKGGSDQFIALAPLYWRLASQRGGINPAVAYAQSYKETAGGNFDGVIDASYNNPCGMKTSDGGGDRDPNAHQHFASWIEGITAHLDHLALYAGATGYPRTDTPDPRHFKFIAGTAKTVEQLGGHWAPAASYGTSVVNDYLKPMQETVVVDWKQEGMSYLKDSKLIVNNHDPDSCPTWAELGQVFKNYNERVKEDA